MEMEMEMKMKREDISYSRRNPKFLWIRKALEGWCVADIMKTILKEVVNCPRDPFKRYQRADILNSFSI